jgi:hypothetical protein
MILSSWALSGISMHWSELRALVEAENVELSIAAIAVPTIPKPKPVVTGTSSGCWRKQSWIGS